MRSEQALKEFKNSLAKYCHNKNYGVGLDDFLNYALWVFHPTKDATAYKAVEYLDKSGNDRDAKLMSDMLHYWSIAADNDGEGFKDVLGDIFMEFVSNGQNGQFFTPDEICDMMAIMTLGKEVKEGTTIADPACGSGRILLAAAKIQRNAIFYGADLSETCCKMTVLNMLINTMTGEVAHMNSISLKHFRSWHIKKVLCENGFYIPYYYTTEKDTTNFVQRMAQSIEAKPAPLPEFKEISKKDFQTTSQITLF